MESVREEDRRNVNITSPAVSADRLLSPTTRALGPCSLWPRCPDSATPAAHAARHAPSPTGLRGAALTALVQEATPVELC